MKVIITILSVLFFILHAQADFTVFAAASTTDVMKELASAFEKESGAKARFNFASSGALARQLDAGAPADLYVSANVKWMDYVEQKGLLSAETRKTITRNSLALIVPTCSSLTFPEFPKNVQGRLAIGNPKSVPAGAYAEAALKNLQHYKSVRTKLIKAKDVRTVLLYVARGEVEAGIVYSTDAQASDRVRMIGTFPQETHPPIIYPAACLKNSGPDALAFLNFLNTEQAQHIFQKHGFAE